MSHLLEIISIISQGCSDSLEIKEAHYTADGLTAIVVDSYDKQEYTLTLKVKNG